MSPAKMRSRIGVAIALPLLVFAIMIVLRPNGGRAHSAFQSCVPPFTVTNLNDSGDGSLRQAILCANANPGADDIFFQDELSGTITLTSGELLITDDLNIHGPGIFVITVDGNKASRVFEIASGKTVTISGLTISDGINLGGVGGGGGGIKNNAGAALTLTSVVLSGNTAMGASGTGGAIENGANLTITNSTLSGNSAFLSGGAISTNIGTLTITDSTLSGNSASNNFGSADGGGITNGGTLTITNSTLSGNSAKSTGGGILNGGTANISFATLAGNSASSGGGIFNNGTLNIKNSIVANSTSGGDCSNSGTWNATGKNFTTNGTCPGFTQVPSTGPGGLNLGPLADNGGPTQTHALLAGSVAIDAAPDCKDVFGTTVTTDQRGVDLNGNPVIRPEGSACDPGAYEFVPCTTQPTITCPESFSVPTDPDKCTAKVDFAAQPNCPCVNNPTKPSIPKQGETCTASCSPAPGSNFPKGTTTVSCTASDSFGNTSQQCSFTITVNDMQPPTVNCPSSFSKNTDPGKCSTTASFTATANDNCDGPLTPTCMPQSGTTFQKGATTVTCSATDSSGNTGVCSFTVTVVDTEKPQFPNGCPNNVNTVAAASCPISTGGTVANFATPSATDNCAVQSVACAPPSGSTFPTGTTTVVCTATDTSGNTATCSFTVSAFSFCLQDESNPGNFVLINAFTGDFSFFCNNVPIASGRGTVTNRGCIVTDEQQKGERRFLAVADLSANIGKGSGTAIIQMPVNTTRCQITDKDMSNNTCVGQQAAVAPATGKHGKPQN